jgi:Tol biopolymer transport system component
MIFADSPSWSPDGKRIAVAAGNIGDEVYSSLLLVDMNGKSSALGPHLGLAGRVCWLADGSGLICTGMPGLNERWQIFHISYLIRTA